MSTFLLLLSILFISRVLSQIVWYELEAGADFVCTAEQVYKIPEYKIKIKDFDFTPIYERYPDGFSVNPYLGSNYSYQTIVCGELANPVCPTGDITKLWSTEQRQVIKNKTECIRGISDWASYYYADLDLNTLTLYAIIEPGNEPKDSKLRGFEISIVNTNSYYETNLTCPNGIMRTNYNIRCENTTDYETTVRGIREDFNKCEWNISFVSDFGCATWSHYDTSSSNNNKLSGGSIFIIIFIVVSTIYVVIGCIYNSFKHGRVGMEACPNKQSWESCCRYTKVGCLVTFDCITCSKGRSSYTAI